jgi:hypothetical protein
MKNGTLFAAAALAMTFAAGPVSNATADEARVEVGTLNCSVEGGVGFIIGSNKDMTCVFNPAGERATEYYSGTIEKAGVDIGWTNETIISWVVFAGTNNYAVGALQGTYGGATAEATIGVGLGANALVGGIDRSFALQPLSVQAQTGLNVAAGLTRVTLRFTH